MNRFATLEQIKKALLAQDMCKRQQLLGSQLCRVSSLCAGLMLRVPDISSLQLYSASPLLAKAKPTPTQANQFDGLAKLLAKGKLLIQTTNWNLNR